MPLAEELEALTDRHLQSVLERDGHGLYLMHPRTGQHVLVAFAMRRSDLDDTARRIRHVLLGIVAAAAALEDREP